MYFDTKAFENKGHDYGKLCPENIGNQGLMAEGEGNWRLLCLRSATIEILHCGKPQNQENQPGRARGRAGRPGWHIECSAMIEHTIGHGGPIDIHGGGVDLKFPHHDNELAQQEAFCNCRQTVNYFAHTGHLHIRGLKMSKSLKNFITIRQALDGVDGLEGVAFDHAHHVLPGPVQRALRLLGQHAPSRRPRYAFVRPQPSHAGSRTRAPWRRSSASSSSTSRRRTVVDRQREVQGAARRSTIARSERSVRCGRAGALLRRLRHA